MARPDRLFRLLHALRTLPAPATAARLAEVTSVSLRSLYRDIDSLRAAGALIDGERGYGYRLVEDMALPPHTFDRIELEALALGMAEVGHMGDPALAAAAASVLAKVAATMPMEREQQLFHAVSRVYRRETRYAFAPDLDVIRQGCWREEAVSVSYVDKAGAVTERTIHPLAIAYLERKLMVLAWCCLRKDFRMFDAGRLSEARLTGSCFRPRRASLLRTYVERLQAGKDGDPGSKSGERRLRPRTAATA
jgi:predicted DNA-binding transcriptional regulator YafY